jgi:1-acyl-sn-glycerol-3-phosphate acyltransferase
LLFAGWYYGITFVLMLGTPALRTPAAGLRYARFWARLVLWGLRIFCDITISVRGRENLPARGAVLIASMHQSAFDTIIWPLLVPAPAYVFKQELLRIPLFGPMLRRSGMIPLDRSARPASVRAFLAAADRAAEGGRQIVIFPEGTRVAPGAEVQLLGGVAAVAARTGLPVVPVATDSGRCWQRGPWRKRPGVIHIVIFPPLRPDLPRQEMMDSLQAAWRAGFHSIGQPVDKAVNEPLPSLSSDTK